MNRAIELVTGEFPRAPALLFCVWIGYVVYGDILSALRPANDAVPAVEEESNDQNVVTHYVKFQTVHLEGFSIETGWQYPANDGSLPEKQWCYSNVPVTFGSHSIHVSLANKEGEEPASFLSVSQASAKHFGLSPSEVEALAKNHCKFI